MSIPSSDIEDFASKLAKYDISLAQYEESLGEDEISSKLKIYVTFQVKTSPVRT